MPESIVLIISAGIGSLMGLAYTFSNFSNSPRNEQLSTNPRVKNLLWVVSGAVTSVLADWKLFSTDNITPVQRGVVVGYYMLGCVITIFVTIVVMAIVIIINCVYVKKNHRSLKHSAIDLVLTFLHSGYSAYSEKLLLLEKTSSPADLQNRENLAQFADAIAVSIQTTLRDAKQGVSLEHRQATIDRILQAAESAVVLMSGGDVTLELKSNYMILVSSEKVARHSSSKPLFTFGEAGRYQHYLVLKRYRGKPGIEVVLPLEPKSSIQHCLPGAPEACLTGDYVVINTKGYNSKSLPKGPKDQVNKFFRGCDFQSVMSIPISKGMDIIGVMNLESNKVDILGPRRDMIPRIARALQPYCSLLGEVAGSIEGDA